MSLLGVFAFPLLLITPGAWITFGLPVSGIPFWLRLFTGVVLSPLVVCAQFYAIRLMGVPFGLTAAALVIMNLPALHLILGQIRKSALPARDPCLVGLFAAALCAGAMAGPVLHMEWRVYSPHAWLYADPVYLFARGDLDLEDPLLAGVRLSYPIWSALVFQAILSFLLDSAPVASWVWTNLVWLLLITGFVVAITKEIGGGRMAQASAVLWLLLGTNPVGYVLLQVLPGLADLHLFGDSRYTPWVNKFYLFSTMPLGLGFLAALLYWLIHPDRATRSWLITLGLLLSGLALFYPLLFPSACGLVFAKAVALRLEGRGVRYQELLPLLGVLIIATLAMWMELWLLEGSREAATSPIALSAFPSVARKTVASVVATLLLLLGLAFAVRDCWKARPGATIVLAGGALASYCLHAAFHLEYWDNEYKFIFVIAMCLAPFAALSTERIWYRWPRSWAVLALVLTGAFLLLPYLHLYRPYWQGNDGNPQGIDADTFHVQLEPPHSWSSICAAIRTRTSPDTVLVTQNADLYFPGFTSRSLYVPPANRMYAGVTLPADVLEAKVRGNGRGILARRRESLNGLFESESAARREESLDRILALGRPVAILAEPRHVALQDWLEKSGRGLRLYRDEGVTLWLVPARS
jgi:hypothetical protein